MKSQSKALSPVPRSRVTVGSPSLFGFSALEAGEDAGTCLGLLWGQNLPCAL